MKRRTFLALLMAILIATVGICSPPRPDFSGKWKQSNERSIPRRTGNVTLHIEHRDPELAVKTNIIRGSAVPRHADQRYTTDGKVSVSTGADGDEFHTSIVWSGQSLAFSIEEHEDGRILLSRETWTLIENGAAIERVRESPEAFLSSSGKQTLIYIREVPQT